jgi:lysophospholipase L1-like esterase
MSLPRIASLALLLAIVPIVASAEEPSRELLASSKRILILGDSITAGGGYVVHFDAWLTGQRLPQPPVVINGGLASETVSGLSEEGHAGGQFPRPDLFERLDRVLKLTKPDLVIACYGINCGIYQPLDEARFAKYREGMTRLKSAVEQAGAKFVVMTPPFYDDLRTPKDDFQYNDVMAHYSKWLLSQREHGWRVIDLNGPMTAYVLKRRETDPKFTLQPDGVHPNDDGHWFMAQQLIAGFSPDDPAKRETPAEMRKRLNLSDEAFKLIQQRTNLRRDAYVGAAGHKRPGVAKGLPVDEAEAKAAELTERIKEGL